MNREGEKRTGTEREGQRRRDKDREGGGRKTGIEKKRRI